MTDSITYSVDYLLNIVEGQDIIRNSATDPRFGFDSTDFIFYTIMSILHPSSYGIKVQNRYIEKHCLVKISSTLNNGDALNITTNKISEIKASFSRVGSFNVKQVRLYQDSVDEYILILIDRSDIRHLKELIYRIPKNRILDVKWHIIHGTNESTKDNVNIEYGRTFDIGSKAWKWLQTFLESERILHYDDSL